MVVDVNQLQWVDGLPPIQFQATLSTAHPAPEQATPLHYFRLLFGANLLLLVQETSRYTEFSGAANWVPVDAEMMEAFTSILIIMSVVRLPRLPMYWSEGHSCLRNNVVASCFTKNRFMEIVHYIHLADSTQRPPGDRVYKVRTYVDDYQ